MRSLVVDDDALQLGLMARVLSSAGDVVLAPDGVAALERLEAEPVAFDVVVTDWQMPRLDGLGLVRKVRSAPALGRLPIVVVSSRSDDESIALAFASGATHFARKPCAPALLRRAVLDAVATSGADRAPDALALGVALEASAAIAFAIAERLSGRLAVWATDGRDGAVQFDRGAATSARLMELRGERALSEIVGLEGARLRFFTGPPDAGAGGDFSRSTGLILVEALELAVQARGLADQPLRAVLPPLPKESPMSVSPVDRTPRDVPGRPSPAAPRPLRIAVVDDEGVTRTLVGKVLATRGHASRLFADAAAALESICADPGDVVVCGLNMPGLAGDALTRELRARLGPAAPPVVMLSGADDEERIGRALDAGARHYVRKPFARGELLAIVERAARESRGPADLEVGARLGPFTLRRELGRGGMGVVFEALRDGASEPVALKVLSQARALEDHLRFRRELDVLSSLDHPGIARLLETGAEGERAYYTMELAPGRSLSSELAVKGALPWPTVARLGRDLAGTLAFLHGRGFIHRDVKPANVVVGPSGHPKLVDFGLARRPRDLSLTATQDVVGTPLYIAPEVLRGAEPSAAGDVFALAVTLVEALRGEHPAPPVFRDSVLGIVELHAQGGLPRVSALVPGAPAPLARVLDAALATAPDRRPGAAELARALGEGLA